MNMVKHVARLLGAAQRAYTRKWAFLGLVFVVFLVSLMLLARLDLLPDAPAATAAVAGAPVVTVTTSSVTKGLVANVPQAVEMPVKIEIPSINLSATVANPSSSDIAVLDQALLRGAVRYPSSAKLGEAGNVILFGHSSYLPIVNNQAYKTFNGIQKLAEGDHITVSSGDEAYVYAVTSVAKESAASEAGIALTKSGHTLTLATCDSFGTKSDRFVVTAELVESYPLVP